MSAEHNTKHDTFDTACYQCDHDYHDDCKGECGDVNCDGPCECDCSKPLSKSEVFRLRRMLEAVK